MLQIYLLTELYFIFISALIFSDTYGTYFIVLINLRNLIYKNIIARIVCLSIGGLLLLFNLLLPMNPGPALIGDFLPSLNLIAIIFYLLKRFSKDENFIDSYKKYDTLGYITLGVAFIHFLFPSYVIL